MDVLPSDALPRNIGRTWENRLETKTETNYIMRLKDNVIDRIVEFRTAWREMAIDSKFADMTLEEFEVATAPPEMIRAEIKALEKQLESKKTKRSDADKAAGELLELVINSMRGTPGFGPDSDLYRGCGYVRKSERKSGLSRKGKIDDTANAA